MSSVIDNYDTNKQWDVVTVVLYNRNMFEQLKSKILYPSLENVFTKEVTDFLHIYFPIQNG